MLTLDRPKLEERVNLLRELRIREARSCFWSFCQTLSPEFYKDDRWHLRLLCDVLQALYQGKLNYHWLDTNDYLKYFPDITKGNFTYRRIMLNMPPRHGKSRTLIMFCQWCYGQKKSERIMSGSYNDDQATDFSRYTRDGMDFQAETPDEITFQDVFPNCKLKFGNKSYGQWALQGEFFSYKGVGVGGSATGKGATIQITDDPVKDAEIAYNEGALDKIWLWYTGTFISRKEEGSIEIMNMTRWASKDPCGRILAGKNRDKWLVLKLQAYTPEQGMLCPELLSLESYNDLKIEADEAIFHANYHQEPLDIQGAVYQSIKTYTSIPNEDGKPLFSKIISYTDTADMGSDYLCSIVAGVYNGEAYILDVYYTKDGMEVTEPQTAKMFVENKVNEAKIESNSGGAGFARSVRRHIWETFKTRSVIVRWFHQSKNKIARILSHSAFVQNHVYFPVNWRDKWPEFYRDITTYQKEGKNKNDDAPDALTGITEMLELKTRAIKRPV